VPEAENDTVEGEKYLKLLLQFTKHDLPLHLPEDVWGIMAPAVLYPGQMEDLYTGLSNDAPCTWEMMVCLYLLPVLTSDAKLSDTVHCLSCVLRDAHRDTPYTIGQWLLGSLKTEMDVCCVCHQFACMQKFKGAYTAKALQEIVTASPAVPEGGEERRILCLVDRVMEPLVRAQWEELLEQPDDSSEQETSLVHTLPFLPRAIDRSRKSRRRGNATKQ
jgi:hypothetical protein